MVRIVQTCWCSSCRRCCKACRRSSRRNLFAWSITLLPLPRIPALHSNTLAASYLPLLL